MIFCNTVEQHCDRPVVLVIDDELGPRESLRFLLKDDYRVLCADSVECGLKLLETNKPDLVIMDIRMPGKNGIEGLREIRKRDTELSVVMLTGFAAVDSAQEAIRNEASDYIEKPFDAAEMRRVVKHRIEQTRLRRKRSSLLSDADALDQRIRELQGKDRLVELGQSSAEFVHDLRNALTAATGSSSLLRMEVEEMLERQSDGVSVAGNYLDSLETSMQRCVEMLDTWQRMIHQTPQQNVRFWLHAFLHECVEPFQPIAQMRQAQILCETEGDDIEVVGDRVQLARVLANLIQNALHALPADNGFVRVRSDVKGTTICVNVSDNGCGITAENMDLIFKPNFTTRRASGGMGLGLFIAQKVVQSHGGTLTVESTAGQGSTFTFTLPRMKSISKNGGSA